MVRAIFVMALLTACSGGADPPFVLTVGPGVDVPPGGSATLHVAVTAAAPVTVTLASPPPGVAADPLALEPGGSGELVLHADRSAHFDGTTGVLATAASGSEEEQSTYLGAGISSGILDTAFGASVATESCQRLVVEADGTILLFNLVLPHPVEVVRLTAAGAPLARDADPNADRLPGSVTAATVTPDGTVLAFGALPADANGELFAFTPEGLIDMGFGDRGVVTATSSTQLGGARDGHIFLWDFETNRATRLDARGRPDPGPAALALPAGFRGAVAMQNGGGWLLFGAAGGHAVALRFDDDGGPAGDLTSGEADSRYVDAVDDRHGGAYLLETAPAGTRVVHVGPGLAPDAAFGDGGRGALLPSELPELQRFVGVDAAAKPIVAAGTYPAIAMRLLRYGFDGQLDPTFRIGGQAAIENVSHGLESTGNVTCGAAVQGEDGILWPGDKLLRIKL